MSDRYYIVTVTGYAVSPGAPGSGSRVSTSFSVRDSAYNHVEVYKEYSTRGTTYRKNSRDSHMECERLNEIDRRAMRAAA